MKGGTVMRRTAWAGLTLLTAPAAFGQAQGMGQWLSEVSTQDGDSIVEPGETATVSLWMDMNPSVGEKLPDGLEVAGFGLGSFDMLAGPGADMGLAIGWEVSETLFVENEGTTDGVSIFDVFIGQPFHLDMDMSDPIFLMSFEWQPNEYKLFDAHYTPFVDVPDKMQDGFLIFAVDQNGVGFPQLWPTTDHVISVQVVPSPVSAIVAAVGGLALAVRRSRTL
jgi:hypothetical protein